MLPGRCQYLLGKFLLDISQYERQIENLRELIIQNLEFNFSNVYKYFAYENKNYIDAKSIFKFLKKNGINSTFNEIQFIIFFYDDNEDSVLSFNELMNLILPDKNYSLKNLVEPVTKCFIYDKKVKLPLSVEYSLISFFEKELELIRLIIDFRNYIKTYPGIDVHDIFHGIKGFDDGITMNNLNTFLKKNYFKYTEEDLRSIIKRLDLHRDSIIDFYEFHEFFCFPVIRCKCCVPCNKCKDNYYGNKKINNYLSSSNSDLKSQNNFINNVNNFYTVVGKVSNNLNLRISPQRNYPPQKDNIYNDNNSIDSNQRNSNLENFEINNYNIQNNNMNNNSNNKIMNNMNNNHNNNNMNNDMNNYNNNMNYNKYNYSNNNMESNYNDMNNNMNTNIYNNYYNKINDYNVNNNFQQNNTINNNKPYDPCEFIYEMYCNNPNIEENEILKDGRRNFLLYLDEVIGIEKKIENSKIELSCQNDFNIEDAFRLFEYKGRGILTEEDLKIGLNLLNLSTSDKDIYLILKRGDIQNNNYLTYEDFFDLMTPFQKDYREDIEKRKPLNKKTKYNKAEIFSNYTIKLIQNLFRLIIISELKIQNLKFSLIDTKRNLQIFFNEIDRFKKGSINCLDLQHYLKVNDYNFTEQECALIFIRMDRNRDGKLELFEIEREIS